MNFSPLTFVNDIDTQCYTIDWVNEYVKQSLHRAELLNTSVSIILIVAIAIFILREYHHNKVNQRLREQLAKQNVSSTKTLD